VIHDDFSWVSGKPESPGYKRDRKPVPSTDIPQPHVMGACPLLSEGGALMHEAQEQCSQKKGSDSRSLPTLLKH
jgi:hypothetical protein